MKDLEKLIDQIPHPYTVECPECDRRVLQIQVWKGTTEKGIRYYHRFWNGEDEVIYCDVRSK